MVNSFGATHEGDMKYSAGYLYPEDDEYAEAVKLIKSVGDEIDKASITIADMDNASTEELEAASEILDEIIGKD